MKKLRAPVMQEELFLQQLTASDVHMQFYLMKRMNGIRKEITETDLVCLGIFITVIMPILLRLCLFF